MLRLAPLTILAGFSAVPSEVGAESHSQTGSKPDIEFPQTFGLIPPPPPVSPRPFAENVPLDGAGELIFPVDITRIGFGDWRSGEPIIIDALLRFDGEGDPLDCAIRSVRTTSGVKLPPGLDRAALRTAFCQQFRSVARFKLASWYGAEVKGGFVNAQVIVRVDHKLKKPLRLVSKEKGTGIVVEVERGKTHPNGLWPLLCDSNGILSRSEDRKVCRLIRDEPGFKSALALEDTPGRRSRYSRIFLETLSAPLSGEAHSKFSYQKTAFQPRYRILPREAYPSVTSDQVEFRLSVSVADNPLWSDGIRSWTGRVSVQLEVLPNGRVQRCVPIESSGNAWVDNSTCSAIVRKARIRFRGERPQGPVFYRTGVTWRSK